MYLTTHHKAFIFGPCTWRVGFHSKTPDPRIMKGQVKICFGLLEILVRYIYLQPFCVCVITLLYPRHLCRGVYSFSLSVHLFVCSFVRTYMYLTTHHKAFIFGPCTWRVGFHSMTPDPRIMKGQVKMCFGLLEILVRYMYLTN